LSESNLIGSFVKIIFFISSSSLNNPNKTKFVSWSLISRTHALKSLLILSNLSNSKALAILFWYFNLSQIIFILSISNTEFNSSVV